MATSPPPACIFISQSTTLSPPKLLLEHFLFPLHCNGQRWAQTGTEESIGALHQGFALADALGTNPQGVPVQLPQATALCRWCCSLGAAWDPPLPAAHAADTSGTERCGSLGSRGDGKACFPQPARSPVLQCRALLRASSVYGYSLFLIAFPRETFFRAVKLSEAMPRAASQEQAC